MKTQLLILLFAISTSGATTACYVESQPAGRRTAQPPPASSGAASGTAADTSYYRPVYYQGYLVFYDGQGRPLYYLNGAHAYVPTTYIYYSYYTWHFQHHRDTYARWYRNRGHRYRNWRYRYWRSRAKYWQARYRRWASSSRRRARRASSHPRARVFVNAPPPRGLGERATVVRSKIRGRSYAFRKCYLRALTKRPHLNTAVTMRFRLRQDGSVDQLVLRGRALSPTLQACLRQQILRWRLGGISRSITYGPMTVRFSNAKAPFPTGLD